jgi:hypothetical protein
MVPTNHGAMGVVFRIFQYPVGELRVLFVSERCFGFQRALKRQGLNGLQRPRTVLRNGGGKNAIWLAESRRDVDC